MDHFQCESLVASVAWKFSLLEVFEGSVNTVQVNVAASSDST